MVWPSILPSFFASMVEFVEALTIVLAIGVMINWKSSLLGAGAALVALAALVAIFGTTLVIYVPIGVLRLVVGVILIFFGMQWLKKALLRYGGLKALHDEAAIYEEKISELKARGDIDPGKFNGFGFLASFKSVLLEGLEVAFIVITFGAAATSIASGIWDASIGALLAFLVVLILGLTIRNPLTRIPENTLKFMVGIMLVTFGTFWAGEGMGIKWPFSDLFLLVLAAFYLALSTAAVWWLKSYGIKKYNHEYELEAVTNTIILILKELFNFFCGDWRIFWGVTLTAILIRLIENLTLFSPFKPFTYIILIIGISSSLVIALRREITGVD